MTWLSTGKSLCDNMSRDADVVAAGRQRGWGAAASWIHEGTRQIRAAGCGEH
jgi:hypothetical protein